MQGTTPHGVPTQQPESITCRSLRGNAHAFKIDFKESARSHAVGTPLCGARKRHVPVLGAAAGTPDGGAVGGRGLVTVDARFDAGYLVSVALGQRLFRGMLYYPPTEPAQVPGSGQNVPCPAERVHARGGC